VNLHKTRKEIERISGTNAGANGGDTNNTLNAVFVGTTGDLLKYTKEMNSNGVLTNALKVLDAEVVTPTLNKSEDK
jgi:hypothetical protein